MRWPWRRHGRRRRADAPPLPQIDPWGASWGDTFLPQLQSEPQQQTAAEPVHRPVESPSAACVRLGFSDGTDVELADSADARAMQALAAQLTATRTPV
jgi:hypothetical protein